MVKKELIKTKLKKRKGPTVNKRASQRDPDPWKEIRLKLQPIGKAYRHFMERRKVVKLKEEQKKIKG